MPYVCTRDGHLFDDWPGNYCPEHGSPVILDCNRCGARWGVIPEGDFEERGARFCWQCGSPGPWVSRAELIAWLKDRLPGQGLDDATVLKLREVLDKIARMSPDDSIALPGWEELRKLAPKVWDIAKPVMGSLIAESLKRRLGIS